MFRLPSALAGPGRDSGSVPQLQDLVALFHFRGDEAGWGGSGILNLEREFMGFWG